MNRNQVLEHVEKEFFTAAVARKEGNEGKVRVCARRAAGAAIRFWLEANPREGWGGDAMSQLRGLQRDPAIPDEVRAAAMRLTARITRQFQSPFTTDPIDDSRIIIRHLIA